MEKDFKGKGKVEVSRFKGLGEMLAGQLKETTMDPKKRTLLQVRVIEDAETRSSVSWATSRKRASPSFRSGPPSPRSSISEINLSDP